MTIWGAPVSVYPLCLLTLSSCNTSAEVFPNTAVAMLTLKYSDCLLKSYCKRKKSGGEWGWFFLGTIWPHVSNASSGNKKKGKGHLLMSSSAKSVNLVWLLNPLVTANLGATQSVWMSLQATESSAALCCVLLQCGVFQCVHSSLTWCSTLFFVPPL